MTTSRKRLGVEKILCDVTTNASVVLANEGGVGNRPVLENVPRFHDHPGSAGVQGQLMIAAEVRYFSHFPIMDFYHVIGSDQSHYEVIAGNPVYRAFEKINKIFVLNK